MYIKKVPEYRYPCTAVRIFDLKKLFRVNFYGYLKKLCLKHTTRTEKCFCGPSPPALDLFAPFHRGAEITNKTKKPPAFRDIIRHGRCFLRCSSTYTTAVPGTSTFIQGCTNFSASKHALSRRARVKRLLNVMPAPPVSQEHLSTAVAPNISMHSTCTY